VTEQLPLAVGGVRVVEAPARPAQYLLLLRSADGGTGAYSVTYDPAGLDDPEPPDEPVDVAWNEAVEDDLGADDPVDQFGYETDGRLTELTVARAPAGTGAFTLRVLDESGTRLVVLDPTLERLEDAPRVGPGERLTIRTVGETGGGTFTLVVAGDGDAAGAYTVDHAVPLVPTGDPTEPNNRRDESVLIRPGDDVAGRIEFADTTDWYVYQSNGRPERFALSRPAAGNDLISVQFVGRGITAPPLTDPFPVQPGGTQVVSVLPPSTGPWNAQVSGQLTGREGAYVLSYLAADDLIAIDPRFVPTTVSAGVENEITPAGAETVDDPGGTETIDHPGGAETVDGPKPSDGPVDAVEPPP
jgi:hypothetical protein